MDHPNEAIPVRSGPFPPIEAVSLHGDAFCLSLHPMTQDHADALWQCAHESSPNVFRHMFFGPFISREEVVTHISERLSAGIAPFVIHSEQLGRIVGSFSLISTDTANGSTEIGSIWLDEKAQGTEILTGTVLLILTHLFETLGYRRVVWKCDTTNEASRYAAQALGFIYEGLFRKHMIFRGRNRDTAWFALTDDDWPEAKVNLNSRFKRKKKMYGDLRTSSDKPGI